MEEPMRPLAPLVFLTLVAAPALAQPVLVDRPSLEQRLRAVAAEVAAVEAKLPPPGAPMPFDRSLAERLRGARAQLEDLLAAIARAPVVGQDRVAVDPPPPPGPPVAAPMEPPTFATLIQHLKGESFSKGQLRVLREAARDHWFLVAQVADVLPLFTFENDRLKALEAVAPRILDRDNGFQLYVLFEFSGSKRQAERLLAK
jgi:hypothetical protein